MAGSSRLWQAGVAHCLAAPRRRGGAPGGSCSRNIAPPPEAPKSRPASSNPLPATADLYKSYVASDKMPGIVGAFGIGNRPTIFVSSGKISYDADAQAAGADSLWRVYSMTKPVTGIAAMILIEEGKLDLDAPIGDILPALKNMTVRLDENSVASRPAARPITIRHLLTHTAGLGYNIVTGVPCWNYITERVSSPLRSTTRPRPNRAKPGPASLQEFVDRVATLPLVADPGTQMELFDRARCARRRDRKAERDVHSTASFRSAFSIR